MLADLRVCFVGDSFVAGVGDPEHRGWVGRVAARTEEAGQPLTAYNLGVRRETSSDVLERCARECQPRLPSSSQARLVVSFGVNDTTHEHGSLRVPPATSVANLQAMLDKLDDLDDHEGGGAPVLVVGPPPVADGEHTDRIVELDARLAAATRDRGVPYIDLAADLVEDPTWRSEVAAGDGSHPGAAGYQRLAELVWPQWWTWLQHVRT